MKLTTASKIRKALRSIGSSPVGTTPTFPASLPSAYQVVWQEYLNMQLVSDIAERYPRLEALYYICMGFVSFVEKLQPKDNKRRTEQSFQLYDPGRSYQKLRLFLRSRKLLTNAVRVYSHTFDVSLTTIPVINAIRNVECVGVIEFKMNGRHRLTEHLKSTTLFPSVPKDLTDKKSYPLVDAVRASSSKGWFSVSVRKGFDLRVARAKFDTLLVEYRFNVNCMLFMGALSEEDSKNRLLEQHRQSVFL